MSLASSFDLFMKLKQVLNRCKGVRCLQQGWEKVHQSSDWNYSELSRDFDDALASGVQASHDIFIGHTKRRKQHG